MLPGFSNCNRFAAKRTFKSSTTAPTAANDSSVGVDVQAVVGLADGGRLGAKAELRRYRTVVPAPERLVVVGDVHGDIGAVWSMRREMVCVCCCACRDEPMAAAGSGSSVLLIPSRTFELLVLKPYVDSLKRTVLCLAPN